MSVECLQKDKEFTRYSPGCVGRIEYPSGLLEMNPKTKRFRRVAGSTCFLHHLENAFGLVALECPKCKKLDKNYRDKIQRDTDMAMEDPEKYTYIPMELLLAPARHTWFLKKHVPAFDIKCWNCGYSFSKGRKATKAERERNERQYWKEIPQASGKLLKAIKSGKKL